MKREGDGKEIKRFIIGLVVRLIIAAVCGVVVATLIYYGLEFVVMKFLGLEHKWMYAVSVIFVGAVVAYYIQAGKENYY